MHHTVIMNRSWLGWPSSIFILLLVKDIDQLVLIKAKPMIECRSFSVSHH